MVENQTKMSPNKMSPSFHAKLQKTSTIPDSKGKKSTIKKIQNNCSKGLAAIQEKDHPFFQKIDCYMFPVNVNNK